MRGDGKNNKQKAGNLKISKLSSVKNPAHRPAIASIIKSANDDKEDSVIKAMFSDVVAQMELSDKHREFMRSAYQMSEAVQDSIRSIVCDPSIQNKKQKLTETLGQYAQAMDATIEGSTVLKSENIEDVMTGNKDMWKLLLEDFPTVKTETAKFTKEGETIMPNKGMTPEEKKAMLEAERKKGAKATAKSILALTADTLEYYKTLDEEGQEAFLAKSVTAQAAEATVAKAGDETLTVDGISIKKSAVDPGVFALLKKQQEQITAGAEAVRKSEEALQKSENIKKGESLFPNLPGTPEEKGEFYKSLMAMPETQRAATMAMLKAGDDAAGTDYNEIGTTLEKNGDVHKAAGDKLVSLAKAIQASTPGITYEKAYVQAMNSSEGSAAYEQARR